jgi:NADH-quinone oxidoreductase subunit C
MSTKALTILQSRFPKAIIEVHSFRGDDTAVINSASIREVCEFLKHDERTLFEMPMDITCVDYSEHPDQPDHRFEMVYHLRSMTHGHRIRLKVQLICELGPEQTVAIDSVCSVWQGAEWLEREVYDMFGVTFNDHPDMRRLLLYPEFKGHPLRKDYPLRGYQPLADMPTLEGDKLSFTTSADEDSRDS